MFQKNLLPISSWYYSEDMCSRFLKNVSNCLPAYNDSRSHKTLTFTILTVRTSNFHSKVCCIDGEKLRKMFQWQVLQQQDGPSCFIIFNSLVTGIEKKSHLMFFNNKFSLIQHSVTLIPSQ